MNRIRPILILLTGLVLAGALTAMVVREFQARAAGREVALTIEGVDPRSLLSGHYVAMAFVEPLRETEMCPVTLSNPPDVAIGWVALSPSGDHWRATGMAKDRPTAARLGVLTVLGSAQCDPREAHIITLDIGIDKFHASQREAEQLSREIGRQSLGKRPPAYALVSIGKDGHARLNGLKVGDHQVRLNW